MMTPCRCNDRGFTLFEVILVLILISIFATLAVWRQQGVDASLRVQTEVLRAHIRYAQMRAMNTDEIWGIGIDAVASSYWLFRDVNNLSNRRALPGETATTVDLGTKGIAISPSATAVTFDTWGRPLSNGTLITDPSLAILLSKNGLNETLAITRNTGFVQ